MPDFPLCLSALKNLARIPHILREKAGLYAAERGFAT
jgi:hypothetical protein